MKLVLLLMLSVGCFAQNETTEKPKTKLESFLAQDGIVIIQGYTTIGILRGMDGTYISVDSKEMLNASTGKKEYGMTIKVAQSLGSNIGSRESISYVDYDEIESLIMGLDYISKVGKSVTKLTDFQAQYSTKDDLSLTAFSGSLGLFANPKSSNVYLSVASGIIGRANAVFKNEDIPQVRSLIAKAKAKLDEIKQ